MPPDQLPGWVQAGGIVAFAAAIWFEQRAIRRAIERLARAQTAQLERERIRDATGPVRAPTPHPVLVDGDDSDRAEP